MKAIVRNALATAALAALVSNAALAAAHASPDDPRAGAIGIPTPPGAPARLPPIRHVFILVLENESFATTFGKPAPAPYLGKTLPSKGALLTHYYGIGHHSLDNYLALISGQAPNSETQADCPYVTDFRLSQPKLDANGQASGKGCIYPPLVRTLADQLEAAKLTWKGYMEDMGNDPAREATTCGHSPLGGEERTGRATPSDSRPRKKCARQSWNSVARRRPTAREPAISWTWALSRPHGRTGPALRWPIRPGANSLMAMR